MKINDRPGPTYQQVINTPAFSPRQQRHGFNSQDRGREQGKKDELNKFFSGHYVWYSLLQKAPYLEGCKLIVLGFDGEEQSRRTANPQRGHAGC